VTGTMCDTVRDRMPEVALGLAEWTADEARHLDACDGCAAEWSLVRVASDLGAEAAGAVDPARTARAVLARHRTEARTFAIRRRAAWAAGLVAVAAALVLLLGRVQWTGSEASPVVADVRLVPELDSLDAAELVLVLNEMEAASTDLLVDPGFGSFEGLEPAELEDVLDAWEG